MEFFDSLIQIRSYWKPCKKWEKEQQDREIQRQELHKKYPTSKEELAKANQYGRTVIDAINTMDQYSINKGQDMEIMSGAGKSLINLGGMGIGAGITFLSLLTKSGRKLIDGNNELRWLLLGVSGFAGSFVSGIFANIIAKFYEKEASRVARYQAREIELQDTRDFVVYTPEQVQQAEKLAQNISDDAPPKAKKSGVIAEYTGAVKSILHLSRDYKNYANWKAKSVIAEEQKPALFNVMDTTPEQIENAKSDRDNLLNVVKKIEIESQNYLSNVEMAINTALACEYIAGGIAGGAVSLAVLAGQQFKMIAKDSKNANLLKKLMPFVAPQLLVMFATPYFIKLEKEAAKIGRFKAKQDLLSDPNSFISYNDDQKKTVSGIKSPPKKKMTFVETIKHDLYLIEQFKKDYKDYKNYKKTSEKNELKLNKALKHMEVTPEQMKEAKHLQKNVFYTFEKMDEKTQRYSNDIVAAADIAKMFSTLGITGIAIYCIDKLLVKNLSKNGIDTKTMINRAKEHQEKYAGAFVLATLLGMGFEILAVKMKKHAIKVGLMSSMNDLQDPKNFIHMETPDGFNDKIDITNNNADNNETNPSVSKQAKEFLKIPG